MNANRIHRVALLLAAGGLLLVAGGCLGVGYTPEGQPIFGVNLDETARAINSGSQDWLAYAIGGPVGALVLGGIKLAQAKARADSESAARVAEKRAWDESAAYHAALNAPPPPRPVAQPAGDAVGGPAGTPVQS